MNRTVQRLLGITEAQQAVYSLTLSVDYEYSTADLEVTLDGKYVDGAQADFENGRDVRGVVGAAFAELKDMPAYVRRELLTNADVDLIAKLIEDRVVHGSTQDMPALGYKGAPHTDKMQDYPISTVRVAATREASREPSAAKPSGKVIDIPSTDLR